MRVSKIHTRFLRAFPEAHDPCGGSSGNVLVAPVESSAEGTLIFDTPQALMGKMLKGFKISFQNGKLKSFDAKENLESFANMYRGATGDKDHLGSFSIGINPNAQFIGMIGADDLALGGVTIGIGGTRTLEGGTTRPSDTLRPLAKPPLRSMKDP